MLKIILGTTSEEKKKLLEIVLETLQIDGEISQVSVDSGISDQPLDENETIQGAINRANNALITNDQADVSVGMEGGLVKLLDGIFYLVCAVSITDKQNIYLGVSSKLRLPKAVSQDIDKGESFGAKIREYQKKHVKSKSLDIYVNQLIRRDTAFTEALRNAFILYQNREH